MLGRSLALFVDDRGIYIYLAEKKKRVGRVEIRSTMYIVDQRECRRWARGVDIL